MLQLLLASSSLPSPAKWVIQVVHGHAEAVIPFSITSQPIRPVYHMAGVVGNGRRGVHSHSLDFEFWFKESFLDQMTSFQRLYPCSRSVFMIEAQVHRLRLVTGPQVPVFEISNHYQASDTARSMLVTNQHLGAGLASAFAPKSLVSSIKSYFSSTTAAPVFFPPLVTALMRGHGFTCVGRSIEESVFRSIFLCSNARIQTTAILMQNAFNNQGFMTQKTAQDKQQFVPESVHYLSGKEGTDAWSALQGSVERPWKLWCAEVEKSGFYENTLGPPPGA